jgi:hypothetical protein
MNLYDNAKIIADQVLTQKWNSEVAKDELKNCTIKIHSIVMGTSKTFHFDVHLPSGRVHNFKIENNKIEHKIF